MREYVGRRLVHFALAPLLVALSPPCRAAEACGVGETTRGGVTFGLLSKRQDSQAPYVYYLHIDVPSSDGKFAFSAGYELKDDGSIEPHIWMIKTFLKLDPASEPAGERIKWKFLEGDWMTSGFVARPYTLASPGTRAYYEFKVAQSGQFAFNESALAHLRQGGRVNLVRLEPNGEEFGAGMIDYPKPAVVQAMYDEAKARALGTMAPCKPPIILNVAPTN